MKRIFFSFMIVLVLLAFGGWSEAEKNPDAAENEGNTASLVNTVEIEWENGRSVHEIYSDGTEKETATYYFDYEAGQRSRRVERFYENGLCMKEISYDDASNVTEAAEYKYDGEGNIIYSRIEWADGSSFLEEQEGNCVKGTHLNTDGSKLVDYTDRNGERIKSIYYFPSGNSTATRREAYYKDSVIQEVYTYEKNNELLSKEVYEYDRNGNFAKRVNYNKAGEIIFIEDGYTQKTYYSAQSYWIASHYVYILAGILAIVIAAFAGILIYVKKNRN